MASLQQLIIDRIGREGPISFADYMRMALYEPGYGYYVTGPDKMGWTGDYFTSSDVSDLFARCLGRQLFQMWELLGCPAPFVVIEQGAGRGHLAQGILSWAAQEYPDFHSALVYTIHDIYNGQDATERAEGIEPPHVLLSNELVDAFPVHLIEKRGSQLYEVSVTEQAGCLCEVLAEPSSQEVATYLDHYKIPWTTFDDGWRAEINLDASRWIAQSAQLLLTPSSSRMKRTRKTRGFLLVIDYGEKARELYTPYRYRGTLACYFQHQFNERPLIRPGEQDITAHVNFSALIETGRQHGMRLHSYTTQRAWLQDLGIYEELERIRARDYALIDSTQRATDQGQVALLQWYDLRQRVATLTSPTGMGNFKVLILKHL